MLIKLLILSFGIILAFLSYSSPGYSIQDSNCIKATDVDFDGDGILNVWEEDGVDINHDNLTDLELRNVSDPMHKDIFLELDYMENHRPNQTGMNNVVNAFNNAPVCNPDGQQGINLHISIDDMIPHDQNTRIHCTETKNILSSQQDEPSENNWLEFQNIKQDFFGTDSDRTNENYKNIFEAKNSVYYYGVFVHQINNIQDSGCAHESERLFVVSLGNESWWQLDDVIGKDPITNDTKNDAVFQARSLMHELGHTLGLAHGGNKSLNDLNYKPNYLSVMNYLYLFPDSKMKDVSFLDYSRCALPDINEVTVDDSKGIDIGSCINSLNNERIWVGHHEYNNNTATCEPDTIVSFNTPVNWSQNREPGSSFTDINCDGRKMDVLRGSNDWENIQYLRK